MATSDAPQEQSSPSRPLSGVGHFDSAMQRIGTALRGLQYGSVLAIIQDGVVIQIERTEKTRLGKLPTRRTRGD